MLGILLVDASADARGTYRELLSMYTAGDRYRFIEAGSGDEGLAGCARRDIDCVLLAESLPDRSALELLKTLAERGPLPPVIVVGESDDEPARSQALAAGAQERLLRRSLSAKTLAHGVVDAIKRTAQERERREREASERRAAAARERAERARRQRALGAARARHAKVYVPARLEFDEVQVSGAAWELSKAGARIEEISASPAPGATVELTLCIPDSSDVAVRARVDQATDTGGVRLSFDALDPLRREQLRVLASRLRREAGRPKLSLE